jgi:hypothetical protein
LLLLVDTNSTEQRISWEAVINLAKIFSALMEHESLLPFSQEHSIGPYPEPDESNLPIGLFP